MTIIIKRKISKNKQILGASNITITVPYLDIFFDVEAEGKQYIDMDNNGFFPLEIRDNNYTDEQITQICESWITNNNILSIYKPSYNTLEEKMIAEKKLEILERQAKEELGL